MSWYQPKTYVVEAKRCTPETAEEVARWCGGEVVYDVKPSDHDDIRIYVKVPTVNGVLDAETAYKGGHYVVKDEKGVFTVEDPELFESEFDIIQRDPYGD